jgi:hypothetical protein
VRLLVVPAILACAQGRARRIDEGQNATGRGEALDRPAR